MNNKMTITKKTSTSKKNTSIKTKELNKETTNNKYKAKSVEDVQLIYSLLREEYPKNQIHIEYNDNTSEYTLQLSDELFKEDPEIPVDLCIKIIYGDSVTGDTPLLLKKDGQVYIETIENIFDESKKVEYPGFKMFDQTIRLEKEYSTTDYQVWCDIGWVDIRKVIRHKCDKKIYRVLTHTGCIDVTEDHSLIRENLETVKPGELKVGDLLLHSFPTEFVEMKETMVKLKKEITQIKVCKVCNIEKDIHEFYKKKDGYNSKCKECDYYKTSHRPLRNIIKNFKFEDYILTEKEAEVWGFFQGDGSTGSYHCKSGIKNSWTLNNNNMNRLNYFKDILESIEPVQFVILDTLKSSGVYKLVPKGSIKYMVEKYRKLFYYQKDCNTEGDKYKIVPQCILNASKEIKLAYWKGYWEADGAKTCGKNIDNPSFAVKGKIGAQCMYYLMRSIGFNMYINIRENDPKKKEIYSLSKTTFKQKKECEVKKIIEKEPITDYVYDLETEIGRFGAGVGQMQGQNTDSIFISMKYNREDFNQNRLDTFRLSEICGEKLTKEVFNRPPIEMEFEKVFQPFILLTKKRYIGKKYDNMKDPFDLKAITSAGIALTRRDYCIMVKDCYSEVIDQIMNNKLNDALAIYKKYLDDIETYGIPSEKLIISAALAKNYSCANCKLKCEWMGLRCVKCKTDIPRGNIKGKECPQCQREFECVHIFSLAHVNLATKLLQRKEEIQVNDRIQYIFIEKDTTLLTKKTSSKGDLAEDPQYAKEHDLKFNRICYTEQLAKPLLSFFKVILKLEEDEYLLSDLIEYTNEKMESYGGSRFKHTDFKLNDE